MLMFTRDVEQIARRLGRNTCIIFFVDVVSVNERSPHACVSAQERKS